MIQSLEISQVHNQKAYLGELKGTQESSRELEGTHGNPWQLKGSARRATRGKISQTLEGEKRKHRSALRALNKASWS